MVLWQQQQQQQQQGQGSLFGTLSSGLPLGPSSNSGSGHSWPGSLMAALQASSDHLLPLSGSGNTSKSSLESLLQAAECMELEATGGGGGAAAAATPAPEPSPAGGLRQAELLQMMQADPQLLGSLAAVVAAAAAAQQGMAPGSAAGVGPAAPPQPAWGLPRLHDAG
jgi:hypothetical protein